MRLVPVSEKTLGYGREVLDLLRSGGVRASIDEHNDKLGAKIRRAEIDKVPYTAVLGGKEAEGRTVSVRSRARGDEGALPVDSFLARIQAEVRSRSLPEKKTAQPA